jgi:hypothetical protein
MSRFAKQEVFEDELAFACCQHTKAYETRQRLHACFRTGFGFDEMIERLAVRAGKRLELRRSASWHRALRRSRPQNTFRVRQLYSCAQCRAVVMRVSHIDDSLIPYVPRYESGPFWLGQSIVRH